MVGFFVGRMAGRAIQSLDVGHAIRCAHADQIRRDYDNLPLHAVMETARSITLASGLIVEHEGDLAKVKADPRMADRNRWHHQPIPMHPADRARVVDGILRDLGVEP